MATTKYCGNCAYGATRISEAPCCNCDTNLSQWESVYLKPAILAAIVALMILVGSLVYSTVHGDVLEGVDMTMPEPIDWGCD